MLSSAVIRHSAIIVLLAIGPVASLADDQHAFLDPTEHPNRKCESAAAEPVCIGTLHTSGSDATSFKNGNLATTCRQPALRFLSRCSKQRAALRRLLRRW